MTMLRNGVIIPAIIVLAVFIVTVVLMIGRPSAQARLDMFTVEDGRFVLTATNLRKAEIVAVPAGTDITPNSYTTIGDASLEKGPGNVQRWVLAVPAEPVIGVQIFARGYDENGGQAGMFYLPYADATALHDALWGGIDLAEATATGTPSSPSASEPCDECLTEADNGKMVSILEASHITLELPANAYKKASLSVAPEGTLEEVVSDTDPSSADRWVQSFEATGTGTVEITASSTRTNASNFHLTVVISPGAAAAEEGSSSSSYHFFSLF